MLVPVIAKGGVERVYFDNQLLGVVLHHLQGCSWKCIDVITGDMFYGSSKNEAVVKLVNKYREENCIL